MVWKKILFIFNPVSGRSQIKNNLMEILEILSGADFKVVCYATKASGDARRIVREREDDYLYIVCAGGDGTLDEVVSGMMESRDKPFVPIGYIPAGTTNDFATNLHIPSDMRMAAEVIAHGKTFRCDLGRFNKKDYFTYVAAFGVFTGTSYQTPQELKNQLGHFAYILQGVSELGKMRAYHMHVKAIEAKEAENGKNSPYDISTYDVFEEDGRKDADYTKDDDVHIIYTEPDDFNDVVAALQDKYTFASAQIEMVPQNYQTLEKEEDIKNMQKMLDAMEDDDDVQNVYHNWEQ